MPTRKIRDFEPWIPACRHPEHKPPSMRVWEPGEYEHTCPACGQVTRFTVRPSPPLGELCRWRSANREHEAVMRVGRE